MTSFSGLFKENFAALGCFTHLFTHCAKNILSSKIVEKLKDQKTKFTISDFQKSERDFAFVIDKIFKIGTLEKIIKEVDNDLIQKVSTFDVYEGENIPKDKKSVAINVTLQASDKTLTENDLDQISKKIIQIVSEKTGATIRS